MSACFFQINVTVARRKEAIDFVAIDIEKITSDEYALKISAPYPKIATAKAGLVATFGLEHRSGKI